MFKFIQQNSSNLSFIWGFPPQTSRMQAIRNVRILCCSQCVSSSFSMNHMFQTAPVKGLNVRNAPGWVRTDSRAQVQRWGVGFISASRFTSVIRSVWVACLKRVPGKCVLHFTSYVLVQFLPHLIKRVFLASESQYRSKVRSYSITYN